MAKAEVLHDRGMVVFKMRSPATTVKAELASAEARRALTGEFLGSLLFVIFGAGAVALTGGMLAEKLGSARLLVIALAHGLAFMLLVAATMPISGGHLNPAVTLAAMMSRRISLTRGGLYVAMQCAGAVVGAFLLTVMIPPGFHAGLGASAVGMRVTAIGGLLTEIVVTFVLVSAMLATTLGTSRSASIGVAVVGVTCVLAHLFAVPLTGAAMNPARSFGPAFMTGAWRDQWIFWMGPLIGAALAAWVRSFLLPRDRRS